MTDIAPQIRAAQILIPCTDLAAELRFFTGTLGFKVAMMTLDIFRASVIELPEEETQRRKDATNPEWPIAHVVLHGVSRDQFMARHKANHAQLVYAPDAETADKALVAKAAMLQGMGIKVNLIGDVNI